MGVSLRTTLKDGSYVDWNIVSIHPDRWRPHGVKYRLAWIKQGTCRVLFDNHHGKHDHCHLDGKEIEYDFISVQKLWADFENEVRKLGGPV